MKPSLASSTLQAVWPLVVSIALGLIMFKLVGPMSGGFASKVMLVAGINIVLAVSLTIVNGFTGQFSMGHAGFMAVGGYAAAMIVYYGSMRMWDTVDPMGGALSSISDQILVSGTAAPGSTTDAIVIDGGADLLADTSYALRLTLPDESIVNASIVSESKSYAVGESIRFAPSLAQPPPADTDYEILVVKPIVAKGDWLFVVACLVGGIFAALAGYIVGLPSLRLRGDYLAIVTLGFGEIVRVLLQGTPDQIQPWKAATAKDVPLYKLPLMLGGPKGFNLLPIYTTLFWVYLAVGLTLILVYRLKISSSGRAFLSIREDEVAAQAMGVDITKYKVRAFVLSSFIAGVAGALYGLDIGSISATELGFQKSFDIIIMVVLGGMGSISGATLAAIILTILPELLRDPPPIWPAGAFILLVMIIVQAVRKRWNVKSLIIMAVVTAVLEAARQYCVSRGIVIADYRLVIYALMLILMMILRPEGLFGVNEIWDYLGLRTKKLAKRVRRSQKGAAA